MLQGVEGTSVWTTKKIEVGREKLFIHPRLLVLLTSDTHEVDSYKWPELRNRGGYQRDPLSCRTSTLGHPHE